MIDLLQLRNLVIRPVLEILGHEFPHSYALHVEPCCAQLVGDR